MVCYGTLFCWRNNLAASFQSAYDAVDGIQEVLSVYGLLVLACGYQGRLVADIGDVSAREAGGLLGQELHVEIFHQLDFAQMYLEYLQTLVLLWQVHMYLAVEAAGPHESLVKDVGAVGGGEDDDSGVGPEAVHLREQLVEGVLPRILRFCSLPVLRRLFRL